MYKRQLLHLPEYVFPAAMLVFGYPTAQQRERQKPERVALKHIVHENGYRHMDCLLYTSPAPGGSGNR